MYNANNQIYTGISEYGKIMAIIKSIFVTIIGIIFIIIGIYLVRRKIVRTSFVSGTIIDSPTCFENGGSNNINWDCSIIVSYNINGKDYKIPLNTSGRTHYLSNEKVDLYYDPNNISDIDIGSDDTHPIGYIIIFVTILLIIISIVWAILANKYKSIAAAEGVYDGINMVGGALGGYRMY